MAIVVDKSGNNPLDRRYTMINRMLANLAAVNLATPLYPGEVVLALDTGIRYRGLAVVAGQWGQLTELLS